MDLQKAIADLEAQAAQYREAADRLRALSSGNTPQEAPQTANKAVRTRAAKPAAKAKPKRIMSPEARARIGEATRARHQAKRDGANQPA